MKYIDLTTDLQRQAISEVKKHYEQMKNSMIYGEKPSWDELMLAMKNLQEMVRMCGC